MSLTSAFQIGNSALTASQLAIQVAGNNLANAATPGYSRQIAFLSPSRSDVVGRLSIGTGVQIDDIQRQVDQSLQSRLYTGISAESATNQQYQILSQVETSLGQLGDGDLTSKLNSFFDAWSTRATHPESSGTVVENGRDLAQFLHQLRGDLVGQKHSLDDQLGAAVNTADGLLGQIADLNKSVSEAEAGGGQANSLRDQRDQLITQLSQYADISTVQHANGTMDVLIGSTPVVIGDRSRGLQVQQLSQNGQLVPTITAKDNGQSLQVQAGQIGSIVADREGAVSATVTTLDSLTGQLINSVNRLHSTGTPTGGFTTLSGAVSIATADRSKAFNDPTNASFAAMAPKLSTGHITVKVTAPGGATQTVQIPIDLDGRTTSGAVGTGNDTSIGDIQSALNNIPGLSAQVTADGRLKIDAGSGFSFSFTEDTSGVLASLGVNSYFTGTNAADIDVNQTLRSDPSLLAVGGADPTTGQFSEAGTANAIAGLRSAPVPGLGNRSITGAWSDTVAQVGSETASAKSSADAASAVRQNLDAQRSALSGVSVDEESVNLLTFQRQYQGAAKFISVVDEMTQTLISLV